MMFCTCCCAGNVFGTAADKGETLFTAARPTMLCSSPGGAADTLAVGFVRGSVGNPRKMDRLPVAVLEEKFFILNAQSVLVRATLRTPVVKPFSSDTSRVETNSCGLLDGIHVG